MKMRIKFSGTAHLCIYCFLNYTTQANIFLYTYVHRKIKNTLSWWYQKKTTASSSLKIFFSFLSFTYFITVVVFRTKRQIESHMPFHYSCPLLSQCYLYDLACTMKVSMKCYIANIDATRNKKNPERALKIWESPLSFHYTLCSYVRPFLHTVYRKRKLYVCTINAFRHLRSICSQIFTQKSAH